MKFRIEYKVIRIDGDASTTKHVKTTCEKLTDVAELVQQALDSGESLQFLTIRKVNVKDQGEK